MMEELDKLRKAVVEGDPDLAKVLAEKLLKAGFDPSKAINDGVVAGIHEAGELWNKNVYFLPDVVMSAEAFKAAMAVLEKKRPAGSQKSIGKYLICTVEGDIHDLGKSIVVTMLQAAGFAVHDLGVDVPLKTVLSKVSEVKPDIVGFGAYMSTTAATMKDYVAALKKAGYKGKIMIGGVRTSEEYAKQMGADAWGRDGFDAAQKAKKLMGVRK